MFASTGDTDAAGLLDEGGQCVQKLAGIWGGSGSDAYQQTQQRWDSTAQELNTISENINRSGVQYQQAADDAASTLSSSMGFTPPDDGFDFKAMESGEAASAGCTGDACNGGNAGILFGDGGDGAQGGISTAQLTISGTISDPSAVDGRYSFVFDGNADTSGGHTYFDGKFLTAHDLTREQVYLSDTGFDLV
jgi:uncharacterized protein YukE